MAAPNLTQLLSKLRAPIFNTLEATSNARNGNKYLRRRLRGPSVLNYVAEAKLPLLNLRSLAAPNMNKPYFGWDGRTRRDGIDMHLPQHQVTCDGWPEVERKPRPGPPLARGETRFPASWVEDGREYVRFEDVAHKKKIGKGPPKKGQGRRSQMKKKK